jgi:hypothetical protein
MTRQIETVKDPSPDSWLDSGGLTRTMRGGTRHVPNHSGLGYDVGAEIRELVPRS